MEFEKLKQIIADVLNVDPEEITMTTTFMDDLGADSLDIVELVMALEEEFDIEIPDSDAEKVVTVGDVVDYQEFLSGKREEGTVYAAYSLARKLVQAIVGSIGGFALAAIGYQSGAATQTPEVANSIRTLITVIPLVGFVFGTLSLKFVYNLSNKKLAEVNAELEKRRAQ